MNIFISPKIFKDQNNTVNYALEKNWFDYAKKLGINLIIINNSINLNKYFNKFNPSGLIITGGGDIYSKKRNRLNLLRDYSESMYINFFLKKNIPILSVCRGFQLVCNNLNIKSFKIKKHVRVTHNIRIINNDKFLNFKRINTNSYHKYGFFRLNEKFYPLGVCKDSSIEIAKLKNKLMYLIMFHPERYNKDQKKIDEFIKNLFLNK